MDGIIENPNLCHFNATAMVCPTGVSSNCLNAVQVGMVEKIFSPLLNGNGDLIYPAMQPGSELMAVQKLYAEGPFSYSRDSFRYVVYNNPSWDLATFTYQDSLAAESLNPFDIRTWPSLSDLRAFRNANGKMITFHGGQDNQITSFNTERFYDGLLAEAADDYSCQLDDFYRFFRVPGMFYCSAGPGGWVIGQQGGPLANGIAFNNSVNVFAAVVNWVENRVAPKSILGTKFVNDTVGLGIELQRNHCL
ncbi:uncharacterized protein PAC_15465 [Phialocephala subalpina]|uniref:Carboxylic ester hydrolase n=1 Tax=Phialocephala subalpina TaxID=576137 RepID=A0A1L7XKH5_9HELO|nr:uncharacterized protein PAC_15465 [Phialocephala subalpina]